VDKVGASYNRGHLRLGVEPRVSAIEIRPLRPTEIDAFIALSGYAFAGQVPDDPGSHWDRDLDPERHVLVLTEDDEIRSQVLIHPFHAWIEGVRYSMGGLANVATAPEHARRGLAARVVTASLAWMREELGCTGSLLYPTMLPLYAGLGWAHVHDAVHLEGPPGAFAPSPLLPRDPRGRIVRRYADLTDVPLLDALYREYAVPRSCHLERAPSDWAKRAIRIDRSGRRPFLAVWSGGDGTPAGYLTYRLRTEPTRSLRANELIATRPEALQGLLAFLATHHLWEKVELDGGRDIPWVSLVANPHLLQASVPFSHQFMFRIVDLSATFGALPAPAALPAVTIQVTDSAAPWNNGTWEIGPMNTADGSFWSCRPSQATVASASTDIATLSALHAGYLTVRHALDSGRLRAARDALLTLDALLRRSYPPHAEDHF
jgi:predicted acetyltransferase